MGAPRPPPALVSFLLSPLCARGRGFSPFTSLSVPQGSWRSSKERRLSPSRPGEPRWSHSRSRDRPQVSSRPAALAHVEATQRPWPWGPGDLGEGKARFRGLICWVFSSETEGEGERETCPLRKVTVPPGGIRLRVPVPACSLRTPGVRAVGKGSHVRKKCRVCGWEQVRRQAARRVWKS